MDEDKINQLLQFCIKKKKKKSNHIQTKQTETHFLPAYMHILKSHGKEVIRLLFMKALKLDLPQTWLVSGRTQYFNQSPYWWTLFS